MPSSFHVIFLVKRGKADTLGKHLFMPVLLNGKTAEIASAGKLSLSAGIPIPVVKAGRLFFQPLLFIGDNHYYLMIKMLGSLKGEFFQTIGSFPEGNMVILLLKGSW